MPPKLQNQSIQKSFAATIPGLVASAAKKRRATNRLQKRTAKAAALDVLSAPKLSKALERFGDEGAVDAASEEDVSETEDAPLGSLLRPPPFFSSPALPPLLDCISS